MELRSNGRLGREPSIPSFEALHRAGFSGWLDISSHWVRRFGLPRVECARDVMAHLNHLVHGIPPPQELQTLDLKTSQTPILVVALDLKYASTLEADPDPRV